jgi:hypothetical protein
MVGRWYVEKVCLKSVGARCESAPRFYHAFDKLGTEALVSHLVQDDNNAFPPGVVSLSISCSGWVCLKSGARCESAPLFYNAFDKRGGEALVPHLVQDDNDAFPPGVVSLSISCSGWVC